MCDWQNELLTSLLGCGYLDLRVIEDCKYDFDELVQETKDMGYEKPDLNSLAYAMFYKGISEIRAWVNNRIEELKEDFSELDEEEQEELEELEGLEPHEDIESFHNYLDTHVYFTNNDEVYKKYCKEALDEFQENTGFSLD